MHELFTPKFQAKIQTSLLMVVVSLHLTPKRTDLKTELIMPLPPSIKNL
jgi:hypothetical protein